MIIGNELNDLSKQGGGSVLRFGGLICHEEVELLATDQAVSVQVGPVDHLLQFGLLDAVAQVLHHLLEGADRDESALVLVK